MGDLSEWYYKLYYISLKPYLGIRKDIISWQKLCGNYHYQAKFHILQSV